MTGAYRPFDYKSDFAHPITDYELAQLKMAGRVEHYTRHFVWIYALPERGRFRAKTMDRGDRIRVYYLSTGMPRSKISTVQSAFQSSGLADDFLPRSRDGFIVILGKNGAPFRSVRDAEIAQKRVRTRVPEVFTDLSIGFVETKATEKYPLHHMYDYNGTKLDLDEIIASQGDTSVTEGKVIVLAVSQQEEQEAFQKLLNQDMKITVHPASTGEEAVYLMEDHQVDLLVMDIQLADMHAWELLNRLKERINLSLLPIIIIMNDQTVIPIKNITPVFRPVSMALLRHTVWTLLKDRSAK